MKFELSHDALAKVVYDQASTADKMRLKIANFIKGRHQHFKDNKSLLSKEDLEYIKRYLPQLDLETEVKQFIHNSQLAADRKQKLRAAIVIAVVLLLSGSSAVALWGWHEAKLTHDQLHETHDKLRQTFDELRKAQKEKLKQEGLLNMSEDEKNALLIQLQDTQDSLKEALKESNQEKNSLRTEVKEIEDQAKEWRKQLEGIRGAPINWERRKR
ncbi:hypothetical protein PPO43_14195 [Saprospira sp. CCB-QB6]|uniref:hypothetical protein n=1 Tax=Saprospira sp. CCB-QB6 TaxID=3023936 RepID=UPI00234A7805|nr:hypothetical protein [Saprospira sp. CCB-QB6]WCL81122.1 hypothetical protein PPO43_14195 [Saprospira sp. CCB-QB6]